MKNYNEETRRHRLFDHRRYKHIAYCICDDPDVPLETTTVKGIRQLLDCCMMLPHMQYDRKRGAFLLADVIDTIRDALVLEISTFERYDTGFAENIEYYDLHPSDNVFGDIERAIDREWTDLLDRIHQSEMSR